MRRNPILLACLILSCSCYSQPRETRGQYPFVHYTPKDGLVNSRVRKAYQDSKGRMYFLTYGGLSMFDGARFRNYTTQNGLLTDLVNDILEVGDDSLLVAVNSCGLNVLVKGVMKELNQAKNECPFVNQFLKSKDGNIYATTDGGLYRLNSTSFDKLSTVIPGQRDSANYLGALAEYKDFLVFTTNDLKNSLGLYLYNKGTNKITDVIREQFVHNLKTDDTGIIWLSANKTIVILDTTALSEGKLRLIKPTLSYLSQASLIPGNINFNRQGELLTFSSGSGIIHYRKNGSLVRILSPEPSTTVSQDFFIDRENVIWISHDGNGVYKLSNTKLQSVSTYTAKNKSGIKFINAVSPDSCWMVMNDRKWILQTSTINKEFKISPALNARFIHVNNESLYVVDKTNLYITNLTAQPGGTLQFRKILTIPDSSNMGGYSAIDQSGNNIFFESHNIYVVKNTEKIFSFPTQTGDLIEGMYIDKVNRLWVASRGGGLTMFSIHPDEPSHYLKKELQFIKEFELASPRCMAVDDDEQLWVGTRHHGLMGFKIKNRQLIRNYHFQSQNGLTDNFITALACDKNNNVIIGTQTGLDWLIKTKDGYRPENITKSNNVFAYINAVWTDAGQNAYAWTNAGTIFRVDASRANPESSPPQLYIAEIKVNGKNIPVPVQSLRLKYFQRNISFSIAAPTFIDEKQVSFTHLLKGSGNEDWSDTTGFADIPLLNLSPGNYELRVRVFFPSTTYSPQEISFPFSIRTPWWQSTGFQAAMILFFIAFVYFVLRVYFQRAFEKKRIQFEKQQALEKERTRIAVDMHDDLGAGLSKIRFLSETVQRSSHETEQFPNLQNISRSSVELVDKFNEIIWAMNEKNNSLEDLLYYIRNYAAKYCEEYELAYQISLPEQIPSLTLSGETRRHIFLTVKESLHNIVKHAGAKNASLKISVDEMLTIEIADNGKGFNADEKGSTGNGLRSMQQRINSIHGKLIFENNNGTLIRMEIPLHLVATR